MKFWTQKHDVHITEPTCAPCKNTCAQWKKNAQVNPDARRKRNRTKRNSKSLAKSVQGFRKKNVETRSRKKQKSKSLSKSVRDFREKMVETQSEKSKTRKRKQKKKRNRRKKTNIPTP